MFKKITFLLTMCISILIQDLTAQCIPASVRPVFGTVTGSTGTQTFNNMPTGNVVRITAPAAGTFYTISMCSTNGGVAQADGIDDSHLTILSVNSAAAADLGFNDDFCPTTGLNGFGPSQLNYTATAAGDIFVYLTEWTATSPNACVADGVNNTYTMTVTKTGGPPACDAGTLTSSLTQIVCPGLTGTMATTGNSTSGDYSIGFIPGASGTGGNGVGFTITGITALPYVFDEDLNGTLSANTLPVLAGEWIVTLYATTGAGVNCDSTVTASIIFATAANPACGGTGIDAAILNAAISEYTAVPLAQVTPYTPSCIVRNEGASTVTGVSVTTTITANSTNAVVYTSTMTQASLIAGATAPLSAGTSFTPTAVDFYLVEFIISINEADAVAVNDTFLTAISVEDSLYARDFTLLTGVVDGSLGIGLGAIGVLGNVIDINVASNIVGIEGFSDTGLAAGDTVTAKIYNFSGATVGAQIFTQQKILTVLDTSFLSFTLNQALTPGQYFIGLEESLSTNFGIEYSSEIYQTNKSQASVNGAAFGDLEVLGFRAVPLIRARLFSPVACTISDVAPGTQTACVAATNNYTQQVIVTYSTPPATGQLSVNGQIFAITSSPQTVTLTSLTSNGLAVNVIAVFTANTACNYSENAVFTAPANCQSVCTISDVAPGAQTPCVNTTNNYTQQVIVTYSTPPASGSLNVNGQTFAITSSPQTVTLSGLASNGADVSVTASFTANAACTYTENDVFTAPSTCLCPTISVNVNTVNNTNCSSPNGSATAVATGGGAIVSYAWTPSTFGSGATISGLPSGSYSVTVTNGAGCTGTGSGNLSNSAGVNAVVGNVTNPTCNGGANGQITINTTGGTAPITYTWSDQGFATSIFSRSNLIAGSYTVVVSDNAGCSVNLGPITLTAPAALTAVLTASSNVLCNGGNNGTIDMTVLGGTIPYTNSWTNSTSTNTDLSGLSAGTYQLNVVDFNNCPVATGPQVTITEPAAISISLLGTTDASCNGDSDGAANVAVIGGTPGYIYNWGTGNSATEDLSNASAGTYQLVVTDLNSCSETGPSVTVDEPSAITLTLSSTDESSTGTNNGTATVLANGGTEPYASYQWNDANAQTTSTASNLSAGTYNVTVTDANGCSETTVNGVVVDLGNSIRTIALDKFQVYPNPASKEVVISFEASSLTDYEVAVYSTLGKRIFEDQVTQMQDYSRTLDVSMFSAGIYFIEVSTEAGKTSKKLTITK